MMTIIFRMYEEGQYSAPIELTIPIGYGVLYVTITTRWESQRDFPHVRRQPADPSQTLTRGRGSARKNRRNTGRGRVRFAENVEIQRPQNDEESSSDSSDSDIPIPLGSGRATTLNKIFESYHRSVEEGLARHKEEREKEEEERKRKEKEDEDLYIDLSQNEDAE